MSAMVSMPSGVCQSSERGDDEDGDLAHAAAADGLDQRVDDVVGEGRDDSGERAADDDADGHVHDVAAVDELLELLEQLLHWVPLLSSAALTL